MTFLRDIVNDLIETTNLSDPHDIADEVIAGLATEEDRALALKEAVPVFVRQTLSLRRLASPPVTTTAATTTTTTATPPVTTPAFKPPVRSGHDNYSHNVAVVRDAWQDRLDTSLAVGVGVYKRLRECTAEDLKWHAKSLRTLADRTYGKADFYEKIAAAIPAGGTVNDLKSDPTL
jgi:hypothetical protein